MSDFDINEFAEGMDAIGLPFHTINEPEDLPAMDKTYKIIRFYQDDRPAKVIETGLTLEEAQEHCNDESTHGDGWFDGYNEE